MTTSPRKLLSTVADPQILSKMTDLACTVTVTTFLLRSRYTIELIAYEVTRSNFTRITPNEAVTSGLHCKNYPYIHRYFVTSFAYFNKTSSVYRSALRHAIDLQIQTYVKIWKLAKNIRGYTDIFLQCKVTRRSRWPGMLDSQAPANWVQKHFGTQLSEKLCISGWNQHTAVNSNQLLFMLPLSSCFSHSTRIVPLRFHARMS